MDKMVFPSSNVWKIMAIMMMAITMVITVYAAIYR